MSSLLKVISWAVIAIALLAAIGTHQIAVLTLVDLFAPTAAGWWAVLSSVIAFITTAVIGFIGLNIAEMNESSRYANQQARKQLEAFERGFKEKPKTINYTNKGVGLSVASEQTGLMVTALTRQSPAEGLGIAKGDFITHINGITLAYLPDHAAGPAPYSRAPTWT